MSEDIELKNDAVVFSAFVRAQKKFGPALKTSTNPAFRSKYADLSACVEAVIDALHSEGFALTQYTDPSESHVLVRTVLLHESGGLLVLGELQMPVVKNDGHGWGSILTYCRRYSLMTSLGLAPEDDDGNQASRTNNSVAPGVLENHINAIITATDETGLKKAYAEGIKATGFDPDAQKKIIAAKDERKKSLGV